MKVKNKSDMATLKVFKPDYPKNITTGILRAKSQDKIERAE